MTDDERAAYNARLAEHRVVLDAYLARLCPEEVLIEDDDTLRDASGPPAPGNGG